VHMQEVQSRRAHRFESDGNTTHGERGAIAQEC
jgi:hypothetical protein